MMKSQMMKSHLMKSQMMKSRSDVINYFIKQRNYKTYLEIGVREGDNFVNIVCTEKIGVDPSFEKMRESVKPYCVCTTSESSSKILTKIRNLTLFSLMLIIHMNK